MDRYGAGRFSFRSYELLMALLTLLQLTLEGVDSDVYRFLEGICDLVCEEFAACDEELDGRLLIVGYLGL